LVAKAASLLEEFEVEILDLRDYDAPVYSDLLELDGIPNSILNLRKKLNTADAFILSTPEHNGFTTAFFKNILDWLSRIDRKTFDDKPMFLMSATPGGRAGQSVRENLSRLMPRWGANIVVNYGVGNFNQKVIDGLWTKEAELELLENIKQFKKAIQPND
jgi:NAD(P)H-dependent FMN reductase